MIRLSRALAVVLLALMSAAYVILPSSQLVAASKPVIKIAENPWSASRLNAAIAKILLTEQMGFSVEIVTIDENAQWVALSTGDIHISQEVWPSGHAENIEQFIEKRKVVENLGELGVVGKIGWWIPSFLLEEHPELATLEGFKDPENAALFKTAETGQKGRFLAGDPSWVQYDKQIIKNNGLNFEVVSAGSEEALLAALDASIRRRQPIVFYFWTPHSVHAKYKLTEVKLPEHTPECYAVEEDIYCDYPADVLFKIAWSGLKDYASEAYQFFKNFRFSGNDDQIKMIADVEIEEKSIEEAARSWLTKHEDQWKAWIP